MIIRIISATAGGDARINIMQNHEVFVQNALPATGRPADGGLQSQGLDASVATSKT